MIGNIFKKLLGFKKADKKSEEESKVAAVLQVKAEKLSSFLDEKFQLLQSEFSTIRAKCKNLRETNYNLGVMHLEKGNLSDAIFRFRFVKKFWPDLFDTYYQLAYCLVLNQKPLEAKKILEELLIKNPDYNPKARDLLERITTVLGRSSEDA